jgi:arylsulfatase A-like enzyme
MAASAVFLKGAAPPRKNVLLLMTDEHRPHALGVDGDPLARTPNLDALARASVRFDQAYCTNPVCVPSRFSLTRFSHTAGERHVDRSGRRGASGKKDRKTAFAANERVWRDGWHRRMALLGH